MLALDDGFYFFDFKDSKLEQDRAGARGPAAHAPERRQVRPARALLRRRHGRQGGAEALRAVAPRHRPLGHAGRRRHHLLERPVLEPRRQDLLLRRHLPGRDLEVRLRPRDRHAFQQAPVRLVQERQGRRRRLDGRRRGLRVERAAHLGRPGALRARRHRSSAASACRCATSPASSSAATSSTRSTSPRWRG